jgi:hypothetical protein
MPMMVSKRRRANIQLYLFMFLLFTVFELYRHPVICHLLLFYLAPLYFSVHAGLPVFM